MAPKEARYQSRPLAEYSTCTCLRTMHGIRRNDAGVHSLDFNWMSWPSKNVESAHQQLRLIAKPEFWGVTEICDECMSDSDETDICASALYWYGLACLTNMSCIQYVVQNNKWFEVSWLQLDTNTNWSLGLEGVGKAGEASWPSQLPRVDKHTSVCHKTSEMLLGTATTSIPTKWWSSLKTNRF